MSDNKRQPGQAKRQSAEVRGNIQKGYTGDKIPGFDPAAAPLETDAEAAGTSEPLPGKEALNRGPSIGNADANASSHGNAMRPFDGERQARGSRTWLLIAALIIVLIVIAIFVLQF